MSQNGSTEFNAFSENPLKYDYTGKSSEPMYRCNSCGKYFPHSERKLWFDGFTVKCPICNRVDCSVARFGNQSDEEFANKHIHCCF